MEAYSSSISFLPNPHLDLSKFDYILNPIQVYANLYEIKIKKTIRLFQYPYSVTPEIESGDIRIREKIFKNCNKRVKKIYGGFCISGDSLYGMNKIKEANELKTKIYLKGLTEYTINIQKFAKEKLIKQEDIHKDQLAKQFIEILILDILKSNPKVEFNKDVIVKTDEEKKIETDYVSVKFIPGFTLSFMETELGNFLNVSLKNKIIQANNILEFLKDNDYTNKNSQKELVKYLKDRLFKVSYAKKTYRIDDILFDRNPQNQKITHDGQTKNLIQYYEDAHKLKIRDTKQPLILVNKKGPQEKINNLYFIPELCHLTGLDDDEVKDKNFMCQLSDYTKLDPDERIEKTNEFLKLLTDDTRKPKSENNPNESEELSSLEKSNLYGIEVTPYEKFFDAYNMKETNLIAGDDEYVKSNARTFPVLKKVDMLKWLCFYEKNNYYDAENLYNTLSKCSKAFNIKIKEPEWIEMPNKSNEKDWINETEKYMDKNYYSFVVFLIGNNKDRLYQKLKENSLVKNGYVSQVIKVKSISKKGAMSVCSKILLQINAKLQGISYQIEIDKEIKNKKIMVIGVDSSHVRGKRTGVAMVASINENYTDFYNKENIINEDKKEQLNFCVSNFIEEACSEYEKKNKYKPDNIIIYRQGVSLHQKEFLKIEISLIDEVCKNKNIKYYYILVNTKTSFKFFEKNKGKPKKNYNKNKINDSGKYKNPDAGLLIMGGITNKNFFEFYIQPQEVTMGSATPTCFHVAYGNMDFAEKIPKFTFDLCHIYSNWQGTVRIPNVIKCAEKLSKMTAKYTMGELNPDLKFGQVYL